LSVQVLDHTDGMPSSQANGASSPAGWMTRAGSLLLPTSAGLAVVNPQRVDNNARLRKLPVVIENVVVDGYPQLLQGSYALPSEVERVAVAFAGLGFRAPDKMRYRYRLEGFDTDWGDAGTRTEAVYTNLPAGGDPAGGTCPGRYGAAAGQLAHRQLSTQAAAVEYADHRAYAGVEREEPRAGTGRCRA